MIPHDELYYEWLISLIEVPRSFGKNFDDLFAHLHECEFVWVVPGDDNRIQDAKDLRVAFMHTLDYQEYDPMDLKPFVSVLEIIIAVSRILEFVAGGEAPAWAWRLIDNLGLNHFYGRLTHAKRILIDDIIQTLVWRTYDRDGKGGFFPLIFPEDDQTKVEIWYQLNAYVKEIIQS